MQADHGLACTRAALHDNDPCKRVPNDGVLLGLDGGHHVAHGTVSRPVQLLEQGVTEGHASASRLRSLRRRRANDLVDYTHEASFFLGEHPLERQSAWVLGRRLIENLRGVGMPADHDRVEILVPNSSTAHVHRLVVGQRHFAEYQLPGAARLLQDS